MYYAEIFWNNIASLVLIPIVVTIVLKLKNAQIDSLREQNNILKEQAKLLGLFRVSEVDKDFKVVKNRLEEKNKKMDELEKELAEAGEKIRDKETLSREQVVEIVRLFEVAINYLGLIPHNAGQSAMGEISTTLYVMEGPIGVLWKELVDKRKQEALRKIKERESGSSI